MITVYQDVMTTLISGPMSASQIAEATGRPVVQVRNALYRYASEGKLKSMGTKHTGRHPEAIYALLAPGEYVKKEAPARRICSSVDLVGLFGQQSRCPFLKGE